MNNIPAERGGTADAKVPARLSAHSRKSKGNPRNDVLLERIKTVEDVNMRAYMSDVLLPTMDYLSRNSRKYKTQYYVLSIANIAAGALITIVTAFSKAALIPKILLAVLGASTTAISSLLSLYRSKEQWADNRITRENLLQYLYAYFCNGDEFYKIRDDTEAKNLLLYQLCQNELSNIVGNWRSRVEKADTAKSGGRDS